jgi:two-component system, OmpR family, phosphate regulon response regulator OmpR
MNMRLLVVEPDQAVRDELRAHFHREQIEMSVLYNATFLVRRVEQELPTAIVMRAELPVSESHAALRRLRAAGYDMPVVMISKSADVIDKIIAFELGADDYLVEPFDIRELTVRLRTVVRRRASVVYAAPEIRERYSFGDWQIDFATRRLIKDDEEVDLRSSEFALLKVFAVNPLKIMSRPSLIALLGMRDTGQTERGLDVLVFRLRSVIEPDVGSPQYIQTVRGRGYIFVPCGETGKGSEARDARSNRIKTPRIPVSTEYTQMHEAWA